MDVQYTFKRYEKKYILSHEQYQYLYKKLQEYMEPDLYGRYTICNIYFDTDDFALIRKSIEKPAYKEKFRMRSYGVVTREADVFAEIKKKFKGVVYKRRVDTHWDSFLEFIKKGGDTQEPVSEDVHSATEMREFIRRYDIKPKVFLAYDREAFAGIEDSEIRLTFDKNIRWRDYDLNLYTDDSGMPVQPGENSVIMEIKVPYAIPLWLTKILSENQLYPGSFSKYGTCYTNFLANKIFAEREE